MENEELIKMAKKLEAEYHKQWRAKNKDKVKEINQRYWLNKAIKELQKNGYEVIKKES